MSCVHCTAICEVDETGSCYEHYAFRNNEAAICYLKEDIDGHHWILAIESTVTKWFVTDIDFIPIAFCPWCGRRLDDGKGAGE